MPSPIVAAVVRSAHPLPSLAVTSAATLLAMGARNGPSTCLLIAAAVLAGQLSIGWSNDRIDAERDRRVGHQGKPLAYGTVPPRAIDIAIAASIAATIALSLSLGWPAAGLHLLAVTVAWSYNLCLKRTWLSWLPYALAFGALPGVATLALPGHPAPAVWVVAAAAILGTAVNFLNAVQTLAHHPRSDVRGLPDRLGGKASLVIGAGLLISSAVIVAVGPAGGTKVLGWVQLGITATGTCLGVPLFWRVAQTRLPFYGLLIVAPVQLLVAVITGKPLH